MEFEYLPLYRALETAFLDAKRQQDKHTDLVGKKPLGGWDQRKHDAYHFREAYRARIAAEFLRSRMYQIDPD